MVKLGIICEDESGKIILQSAEFRKMLQTLDIDLIAIEETGSKNQFFAGRYQKWRNLMVDKGAEKIIAFFDLDKDECLVETKSNSDLDKSDDICVIANTELESWYLADSKALSSLLNKDAVFEKPEMFENPIREIVSLNNGKGFGNSKPFLAKKMLRNGFSIENAAKHPNCDSAKYFIKKLKSLSN
ncbi:hypothetical protein EGI26_16765 [Lacihabitans sp. CCS-44]|uniref:DUF4276 family protein n=1 Tax=Lacihabitans sp. CCS-44 TaxID=2487331 RepID=UPI0020CF2C5F|nr:DUF4276 family protein [Lacihabitans sp. CCS-44]MCP9756819.1 hypothetical protein [Lacihabitans sp. CCS-44]